MVTAVISAVRPLLATALIALVALAMTAPAPAQAPVGQVSIATSDEYAELVKTLPIGRREGQKRRVVMNVPPKRLGSLQDGDRLDVQSEFEVTVCLKPNPLHPGPGFPCIGDIYGYNPAVDARIVLAPSDDASSPARTLAIPGAHDDLRCTQDQPHRNHHCVLTLREGRLDVDESRLPCQPNRCHLNLVVTAHHPSAGRGEKVVVGSNSRDGEINQKRGRLDAVLLRPGDLDRPPLEVTERRERGAIPIAREGADPIHRVVYSLRLPDLKQGEKLVAEGKVEARIGQHPYSVLQTTHMTLASSPTDLEPDRLSNHTTGIDAEMGKRNGFNCTQGESAHRDPCTARKIGVVQVKNSARRPVFLNLIVGMSAKFPGEKWRAGDEAKILDKGFVEVRRYPAN